MKRLLWILISWLALAGQGTASSWFPPILPREEAEKEMERLREKLRSGPAMAEDYYRLGALYFVQTASTSQANIYLRRAAQLAPDHAMAQFLYALELERRGDYAKALDPLMTLCESGADYPVLELAARTIRSYLGNVKGFAEKVEPVFRKLLRSSASLPPEVTHIVREVLSDIYERTGREELRSRMRKEMGQIDEWWLGGGTESELQWSPGPFGQSPNLDFDVAFPLEAELWPSTEFDWHGQTVRFDANRNFGDEWVRPYGKEFREGTFYAKTIVEIDWFQGPQKVIVHLESHDNIKMFVNGECVFVRDHRRGWAREKSSFTLEMPGGSHSILVKDSSDAEPGGFRLFMTDSSGRAVKEYVGLWDVSPFHATPGLKAQPVTQTAEHYCDQILERDSAEPWAHFVKGWIASEAGDPIEARVHLEQAVAAASDFAEFHFYLARFYNDDVSLSKEEASARARQHYQKAAELAEDFAIALDEISEFDLMESQPREAIRTLHRCASINPHYWGYQLSLFLAFRNKGWNELAKQALEASLSLNPDAEYALSLGLQWAESQQDFVRAGQCARRLHQVSAQSTYTAQHLEDQGRWQEAAWEYQRLIRRRPLEPSYRLSLADLYRRSGQLDRAQEALWEALELSPNPEDVHLEIATVYFQGGKKEEGKGRLLEALKERPTDLSLRQALFLLGEKDEFEEFRIPLDRVLSERDAQIPHTGVSTVYWLDQFVTHVFPDGSSLDLTHIIAKVMDKDGVARMGEIHVPAGARIYHLRVVKPNGEILQPEILSSKESYTMSGLAPGDLVEFEHLVATEGLGIPKAYPGANFTFNSLEIPTERAQLVILTPAGYPLQHRFQNASVKPEIQPREGLTVYRWDMKNPSTVHREPKSVPYQEYLPFVQFSGGLTWEAVREYYANALMGLLRVSPEMKAEVRKATMGISDVREQAEKIFRLAEDRIKDPTGTTALDHPAHLIFSERAGNMLVLLKALYDDAGIPADVIFAYSQAQVLPLMDVPNLGTFPHGLLRLRLPGGQDLWLEPVRSGVPFGYVSPGFGGTRGLLVLGQGGPFIEIPKRFAAQDLIATRWDAAISADGDVEASVVTDYTGFPAGAMRILAENYTDQLWVQTIERNLSAAIRGAAVSDVAIENLEDIEKPVRVRYRFKASRFARREGNSLRVNQLLGGHNMVQRFAALPGRRIPLLIASPVESRMETKLVFPAGCILKQSPEKTTVETPFAKFVTAVQPGDAWVEVVRSMSLPIQRVPPGDYPAFSQFCQAVDKNESMEIVVKLPD